MIVARCIAEGLVGGEGLAVDGSIVRADLNRQHAVNGPDVLPDPATSHAVCEYLAILDNAAFEGATTVPPKQLAVVDPAARRTAASRERALFAYATTHLIDLQHAVIVDVEATTAIRQAEVTTQRRMIDRTQERFGLWPEWLVGDTGYGDAKNLSWLVEESGIEPHITVFDKSARRDDTFERSAFTFDHEDDSYICPEGKRLRQCQRVYSNARQQVDEDGMLRYRASKLDCGACALKPRLCKTRLARKILRSIHEGAQSRRRVFQHNRVGLQTLGNPYLDCRNRHRQDQAMYPAPLGTFSACAGM